MNASLLVAKLRHGGLTTAEQFAAADLVERMRDDLAILRTERARAERVNADVPRPGWGSLDPRYGSTERTVPDVAGRDLRQ